jgi:hypothetical protein
VTTIRGPAATSSDPIGLAGGGINTYAYGSNDPLGHIDPLGTQGTASGAVEGEIGVGTDYGGYCSGGGGKDPYQKCLDAADGSDSDWENFCNSIPFSEQNNVVGGGPAQIACREHQHSSPVEKRNWCENQYGNH